MRKTTKFNEKFKKMQFKYINSDSFKNFSLFSSSNIQSIVSKRPDESSTVSKVFSRVIICPLKFMSFEVMVRVHVYVLPQTNI